jgi:hypothetical protein
MPDYPQAIQCLQENLALLDGRPEQEVQALWNISNALLVVCDSLKNLETRISNLERSAR